MGSVDSKNYQKKDYLKYRFHENVQNYKKPITFDGFSEPKIHNQYVLQTLKKLGPYQQDLQFNSEHENCESLPPYKFDNGKIYVGFWNNDKQRCGYGKQYWPDGSIYEGYWKNHCAHGKGRRIYSYGEAYDGEWVQDKPQGNCKYYFSNGTEYEGEWFENRQHGQGTKRWSSGAFYQGKYQEGLRHGYGIFQWSDKSIYKGEFKEGKIEGYGEYIQYDGIKYKGFYYDNLFHGKGEMEWPDGSKFIGDFVQNRREGQGTQIYPDGSVYIGEWKNSKYHGKGEFNSSNGDKYIGDYIEQRKEGQGKYYYFNGNIYQGEWKKDLYHGKGEFICPDGSKYKGNYFEKKREGQGIQYFADGSIYKGQWKNDMQYGKGLFVETNGNRIEGEWIEGKKVERAVQIYREEQKKKELYEQAIQKVVEKYTDNQEVQNKIQNIFEKKSIVLNAPQVNIEIDEKEEVEKVLENVLKGEIVQDITQVSQALYVKSQEQQEKIQELLAEGKAEILTIQQIQQQNNNTIENPDVLMYCLQTSFENQGVTLIKTNICSDEQSQINLHNISSFNSEENSAQSFKFQDSEELSYQQLELDKDKLNTFQLNFRENLAKILELPIDSIKIYGIERGSIKIIFDVILPDGRKIEIDQKQRQKFKYIYGAQVQLKPHKLLAICMLQPSDFCHQYNQSWNMNDDEFQIRGKRKYFLPRGWKGYALNVKNNYGDRSWIGMLENSWPVFYHGTKQQNVKNIVEQGLQIGDVQNFEKSICLITQKPIGKGIYISNHVEVAAQYSEEFQIDDKKYLIVFQTRVNPKALRQVKKPSDIKEKRNDPDWDNDYFVVKLTQDIRPYRILLKNVED